MQNFTPDFRQIFDQKIDQILENYHLTSKRNAANFIRNSSIFVNDKKVDSRMFKACSETDVITVNGKPLPSAKNLYIIFNKPLGTVCSAASDSHKTVFDFIKPEDSFSINCGPLHTAGRLDSDTSGLLILTTNGAFSHYISSPETHLPKTYRIALQTPVSINQQQIWQKQCSSGIYLPPEKKAPEYFTKPAELLWHTETQCDLTISEGQFHQVRRMVLQLKNQVQSLERIKTGFLELPENLSPGKYITLSQTEIFNRLFSPDFHTFSS